MATTWIYAGLFLGFLGAAAWCDLRDLRIPNRLTAAMAAAGPVAIWLLGAGVAGVPVALLTGAVTLAVGWTMFELGWLGGGDAKLAAAASVWLGPGAIGLFIVALALCGALLALALLAISRIGPLRRLAGTRWSARLGAATIPVPYAVAMAPAGAVAMLAPLSGAM